MLRSLKLELADGRHWLISPVDGKATAIVAKLGEVMRLAPACRTGRTGENVRELCVTVSDEPAASAPTASITDGTAVCRLAGARQGAQSSTTNLTLQAIGMERIASTVARESLLRGGLLLHAALAEYRGSGFVMAGPSGIGKSTASCRLPPPWRSLCDDMTLVVRDGQGCFWAHPWPTWSRFFFGGQGGSWPVEHAVPLRAIFFLLQSSSDKLEPVNTTQAAAYLLESAINLAQTVVHQVPTPASPVTVGVRAAQSLASTVPAYSLELSLGGRFWEEIERVLPVGTAEAPVEKTGADGPMTNVTLAARDVLRVVYTGPSMNPTLQEPDLLEVRPYGAGQVRPGDIVCFKSPEEDMMVVHRVVAVERRKPGDGRPKEGIRTRGDNNRQTDAWVLQPEDIIGRITAAQRGAWRWAVLGGWKGLMVLRCARLGRGMRKSAGLLPHTLYRLVVGLGPFDHLLPASLRPKLVRFDVRSRVILRLVMGKLTVGQYDDRREEWHIRRPFRLFVDKQTLPSPMSIVQSPESQ